MNKRSEKGTVLITGASSGIGATYANRMALRGYDLLLVARDFPRLQAISARLTESYDVNVEVVQADLTSAADLATVTDRLRGDDTISVLINNAGIAMNGHLAESDLDTIDSMILLNVMSLTHLSSAAASNFKTVGRGAVINVASIVALAPEMFNAAYSATKAYVLSLTQTLSGELSPHGIYVQAVLPGLTRTEIWKRSGIDDSALPPNMIMEVDEMVDAALAGFDQGELITIPSLPNPADWQEFVSARAKLRPNLSHNQAAARYKNK
ncbi:SDR family oxidoreductase [Pseudomonas sp. EL_65y_Pfl1_R32]|uniref:SDR family NAD(P)-dependent oxidoreductase n=1 Tax=Pseudomonas sp. EL_65y_Pfl1_R32 TaxID=3088696 RepID=UPI0030D9E34E